MSKFKLYKNTPATSFDVSYAFIDNYMPEANDTFIKVYLYGLRLCMGGEEEITNAKIAEKLNIRESVVAKAWDYWQKVGVVNITSSDYDLEFINLSYVDIPVPKRTKKQEAPVYSPQEIGIYIKQDPSVSQLFKNAEDKLQRVLTSSEMSLLYSLYDWLHLPFEVVFMLLEYCKSKADRFSMRYVEKVAIGWAQEGINTLEKAEKYLSNIEKTTSNMFKTQKVLGISDRKLSTTEESYINTWIKEYTMDINLIEYAYDVTVSHTNKLSFPYMNSIIASWHSKGIKDIESAKLHSTKSKRDDTKSSKVNTSKNKFVNFEQQNVDYDELNRKLLEKRLKKNNIN